MKALIVVDAQNDFVTGPLGTKEAQAAIPNIKKLIKEMTDEDADTIIITTQDTHYEKNYPETLEGKKLPVFHCGHNTRGWEIVKEVADYSLHDFQDYLWHRGHRRHGSGLCLSQSSGGNPYLRLLH